MVLAESDGDGYERCWQSKNYPGSMHWGKCEKSLSDAREHWNPKHYTFVFPRELSAKEHKTFQEKFGEFGIKVDYWNSLELESRLLSSSEGGRIARAFFDSPELERERTYQAIETGGRLDTPFDALYRNVSLGAFLADRDPYFSYPTSTHEVGQPGSSPPPEAVMSLIEGDEKVRARLDVVPRDYEAMDLYGPEFVLEAATSEAGDRLRKALEDGEAVEIEDGLTFTFTRLPPALEDLVGQPIAGKVVLGQAKRVERGPSPWRARLSASSAEGDAELDIELKPMYQPPEGWDAGLQGEYGGVTATIFVRRRGEGGQLSLNLRYSRNRAPAREQQAALNFARVTTAAGTLIVTDIGGTGRPELQMQTAIVPMSEDLRELLAFFENVRVVEEWAGIEYELPEKLVGRDAMFAAKLAHMIRKGGREIVWSDFTIPLLEGETEPLKGGHILRWEAPVQANLFGRTHRLGFLRADLVDYKLVSEEPVKDEPGYVLAHIEPANDQAARVFERLVKKPTGTTKTSAPAVANHAKYPSGARVVLSRPTRRSPSKRKRGKKKRPRKKR